MLDADDITFAFGVENVKDKYWSHINDEDWYAAIDLWIKSYSDTMPLKDYMIRVFPLGEAR